MRDLQQFTMTQNKSNQPTMNPNVEQETTLLFEIRQSC